jgi:ribosomal protein L37AE/L43A
VNRRKVIGWALVALGFSLTFFTPNTRGNVALSIGYLILAFIPFGLGLYLSGFTIRRKTRGIEENKKIYLREYRTCPRCKQKLKAEKTKCDKCGAKLPDLGIKGGAKK